MLNYASVYVFIKSLFSMQDHCLPAFDNLSELKLVLYDFYNWDLLMKLLDKSPNLEHLVLEHKEVRFSFHPCIALTRSSLLFSFHLCFQDRDYVQHYSFGQRSNFKRKLPSELRWHTPEYVPACLTSHLKTITIRGFKGYQHEKKVARFLFENGIVLDKMAIYNDLGEEFTLFQRGSGTCLAI